VTGLVSPCLGLVAPGFDPDTVKYWVSIERDLEPTFRLENHSAFTVDALEDLVRVADHEAMESAASSALKSVSNAGLRNRCLTANPRVLCDVPNL
jgi:hypothetical protein